MATLENIRKRGPLVAVVIGLALLAFILGDLFTKGSSMFGSSSMQIAEIWGESISVKEYQQRISSLEEIYKIQTQQSTLDERTMKGIRDQVWNQMVRDYVLKDEYKALGIGVDANELVEMVRGVNISADPMIRQIFTDQKTNTFNSAQAVEFFKNLDRDANTKAFGLYLESEMRSNRMYSKYTTLIAKGMNVTDLEARDAYKERMHMVDFNYVYKKFEGAIDTTAKITDQEISTYYEKNKKDYDQEYTRDLAYVSFDVIPSKEDDEAALKYIQKLQGEFTQSPSAETEAYVNRNADTPYDLMKNFKKGELKNVKLDSLIYNAQPGFVFGPYAEEGAYKLAKLINFVNTPDTVQASHILIAPDGQKIKDMKDAQRIADSLKVIIDKGGDFAQLAKTYSADKGSAEKGGDLDKFTEGKMVKPFNDACFTGKVKDIKVVETQFGVHIIKIVYQSKIVQKAHIAFVDRKVQPGKKTFQDYYAKASKFASENTDLKKFDAALTKEGLTKKVVTGLNPMSDVIAGLLSPRIIVQWAFKEETEKGNVSEIFDNGDKFIIAVLTDIKEKGIAPLAQKREEIVQLLRKEKKAAQFVKEMSGNQTLEALAGKGLQILEARNISFSSASLPDGGQEPIVIATAVATAKDKTTAPIIGTNGVYVLKINTITGIQDLAKADVSNDKLSAQNRIQGRGTREGYEALKKVANVIDDRAKFF